MENRLYNSNNRAVINEFGVVRQVTNYYPFGGVFSTNEAAYTKSPDAQPYKYNGKELDRPHGLDWYDYGARQHEPFVPGFTSLDPLCEKYYHISPYAYCANNPVRFIDPDGRDYGVAIDSVSHTITINATYYTLSNSYESAKHAVNIINNQGGDYSYVVNGETYTVNFNLNVIDVGSDDRIVLNEAFNNDKSGYANTYEVVPDEKLGKKEDGLNGQTCMGHFVKVKFSQRFKYTGAHEVGHTLGLLHNIENMGLMTEASSSGGRTSNLQKK